MTKEEKEKLEQIIVAEKDNLLSSIQSLEEGSKPVPPDDAIGRLTRMDAINAKSMNEANLNAARVKLAKLERALTKLDNPDFGICAICEEPIPVGRIMLLPETTVCVKCADR
jgi:DnaK suppressor protein